MNIDAAFPNEISSSVVFATVLETSTTFNQMIVNDLQFGSSVNVDALFLDIEES